MEHHASASRRSEGSRRSRKACAVIVALTLLGGAGLASAASAAVDKNALHQEMLSLAQQMGSLGPQARINPQAASAYKAAEDRYRQISASLGGDDPGHVLSGGVNAKARRTPLRIRKIGKVAPAAPAACGATTTNFTNSTPVVISATGTPVVTSTIVVSGAGPFLYDLDVTTFIQHTFSSDLDVTITSPSGTVVTLTTDNGSTFDDVFNGTVWDDNADPGTQVPYTANNNLVVEHTYANLTLASPLVPEEPLGAFIGEDPNGTWTLTISDDSNLDGGNLNSWSLGVTTLASAPTITTLPTATQSTPVAISTTGTPVVTSTIVVAGAGSILDLNVTTFIQHTFSSDLDVTLTSPAGTVVTLTTDNGSTFDDVFNGTVWNDDADPDTQVPYTADNNLVIEHTYANLTLASPLVPEEPLAAFTGEDPNGTWTLTISDDSNLDGGSLNSWSLDIQTFSCAVAASADLSITKTDGVASVTPGGTTTYTITASNAGTSAANPATVTDTFPAACTSVSYTSTATGGATGNTASGSGNINDAALNLPAGSSVTYTATCSINPGASGSLANTATIFERGGRSRPGQQQRHRHRYVRRLGRPVADQDADDGRRHPRRRQRGLRPDGDQQRAGERHRSRGDRHPAGGPHLRLQQLRRHLRQSDAHLERRRPGGERFGDLQPHRHGQPAGPGHQQRQRHRQRERSDAGQQRRHRHRHRRGCGGRSPDPGHPRPRGARHPAGGERGLRPAPQAPGLELHAARPSSLNPAGRGSPRPAVPSSFTLKVERLMLEFQGDYGAGRA